MGDKSLRDHIANISRNEIKRCINEGFVNSEDGCADVMFKYERFSEVQKFFKALNPDIEEIPSRNVSRRRELVSDADIATISELLAPSIEWYEELEDMESERANQRYRSIAERAA